MTSGVVLDAAAFDVLDGPEGAGLRHLLHLVIGRGGEVRCAPVTLAEVSRGLDRTRRVDAAIARDRGGQRVRVILTDVRRCRERRRLPGTRADLTGAPCYSEPRRRLQSE